VISFTPLPGCFSPFPRGTLRYRSRGVFSLGGWSPQLPTGYLVPRGTRDTAHPPPKRSATGLSPPVADPSRSFASPGDHRCGVRQHAPATRSTPRTQRLPAYTSAVWAPPRSLAATRGILSFPRGTEMFQFPHLPPPRLCVQRRVMGHHAHRVAPFGYRRCTACLRPTVAFRSLPRPSSAPLA
jgi:hypothetical protein